MLLGSGKLSGIFTGGSLLNRLALTLLIILFCATPFVAQTKRKKSNARQGTPQPGTELIAVVDEHFPEVWKPFRSAEGRFSVLLPGEPKKATQVQDVEGRKFTTHILQLLSPNALYEVSFVDFPVEVELPEKAKGTLDALRIDTLEKDKGKLLAELDLFVANHPGRYIVWRTEKGLIWRAKYFLAGYRIYMLSFGVPEESNLPTEIQQFRESIAKKFLDSFIIFAELPK
jgi:hypothetical protein